MLLGAGATNNGRPCRIKACSGFEANVQTVGGLRLVEEYSNQFSVESNDD